jgi:endonuclease G
VTAYKVDQNKELRELEFVCAVFKTYQISGLQVTDATGIDLSALLPYDGFSQHESATATLFEEPIDLLGQAHMMWPCEGTPGLVEVAPQCWLIARTA